MSWSEFGLRRQRRTARSKSRHDPRSKFPVRLNCEMLEERMVLAHSAWTVMMYITADDQLAEGLNGNIKQMESALAQFTANDPNSVQVAVLYDQTQSSTANLFATPLASATGLKPVQTWRNTGQALLQPNSQAPESRGITTPFTLIGAKNSGTPAVFSQFVTWAATNAPADHYGLVFGDHGAGWKGFNNYGDSALTTPAIAGVLETVGSGVNPIKFDLIGFDECLMADVQAQASLAKYTQVIVASEELESGTGWNFQTAFSALNGEDPGSVTPLQVGTGIVNSFTTTYVKGKIDGSKQTDTLSVVQTSALANLQARLNDFTNAVLAPGTTAADWNTLAWARNQSPWYSEGQGEGYRDLGRFLSAVANSKNVSASIKTAAAAANSALTAAVLVKTKDSRQSSGLTVYLPAPGEIISAEYFDPNNVAKPGLAATFVAATNWYNFLVAFTQNAPEQATVPASFTGGGNNRSVETAYDLHQLIGPNNTFAGLSLPVADPEADNDYFHFAIAAAGLEGNAVTAKYTPGAGNLELTLLDAQANVIGHSDSATGVESISLTGLPAGDYYLVINSSNEESVSSYTLSINAPTPNTIPPDWVTGNTSQDAAFDLGTIATVAQFSGLTLAAGETDWFRFELAPGPNPQDGGPHSLTIAGSNGQELAVQVLNSQGQVLTTHAGNGSVTMTYPEVPGGSYFLKVSGGPGGYAVQFNPPVMTSESLELDSDSLAPGVAFTLGGNVENAGTPQSHSILINWGDGSPQTTLSLIAGDTTFQAAHQYTLVGNYLITVTAVSADGVVGSGTVDAEVQVKVEDIPNVSAGPDITLFAGQILTRAGSVTVVNGTPIEATVNYGDGTGLQPITLNADGTFVLSHQYANTGVFTATVQVMDTVGAIGTASFGVNTLAAPTVSIPSVQLLPITLSLTHGAEFYAAIVQQEYQLVLQRAPEAAAVTYWVTQIQEGLSQQTLAAALVSSTEFVASQSNAAWLDSVYQRLFDRAPDQSGQQYWNGLLAGGTSKGSVAMAITNSAEFLQTQIASYYSQILGRSADASGLAFWTARLSEGTRLEEVAANLLASDEFFTAPSHGSNNAVTWIDAAYAAAFGRPGSTAEEAFWLGQI